MLRMVRLELFCYSRAHLIGFRPVLVLKVLIHPPESEAIELKMAEDHAADFLTVLCSELDKQVQDRQLPVVSVEEFNYLAPLELYKRQKPYLSRLPFLRDLKRSNIIARVTP